jgi:glycosyltransferase involved in cell wall biosynthesis
MKILHIAFSGLGGHGNVFFSMADADKEKQHQFEIIFFGNEEVREGYIQKAKQRNIPWYFVKKKPGFDFDSYRQIRKIIKETLPDIIFLHSSSYIFPVKRAVAFNNKKIKIIVRETQPNHLKTKLNWLGLCVSLVAATKVVFLSTEYRDVIKKKLALFFSDKRTALIPNGVDLDVYKPAEKSAHEGIKIGMQSRLSEMKDHATLLDAFAMVLKENATANSKLYIAGDGVCRPGLEKQAQDLNISHAVEFTGMLEETELPAFINSLDIYVHATLGETMSTAIMQVMACKMPVIASDVLGVNNMIKHEQNGLLVPAKNATSLKDAIMQLINDQDLSATLAANAFTFATENYSNEKMLSRYNEIFIS